jgi:hypothetical protein
MADLSVHFCIYLPSVHYCTGYLLTVPANGKLGTNVFAVVLSLDLHTVSLIQGTFSRDGLVVKIYAAEDC